MTIQAIESRVRGRQYVGYRQGVAEFALTTGHVSRPKSAAGTPHEASEIQHELPARLAVSARGICQWGMGSFNAHHPAIHGMAK